MNRLEAYLFNFANLLVCGTGAIYAWMLYCLEPLDEFSILNHPMQADLQAWHILSAPLLIFMAALLWKNHVWAKMKSGNKRSRRSGFGLALNLMPMIFSGYLLQTTTDETWSEIWMVMHLCTSGLWICATLVHLFLSYRSDGKLSK
jgi:nitric oxide reductase large subunit